MRSACANPGKWLRAGQNQEVMPAGYESPADARTVGVARRRRAKSVFAGYADDPSTASVGPGYWEAASIAGDRAHKLSGRRPARPFRAPVPDGRRATGPVP